MIPLFAQTCRVSRACSAPRLSSALPSTIRPTPRTPTLTLAVRFSRLSRDTPASTIQQALKEDGFIVIESMFTPAQVARFNRDIDAALSAVPAGKPANTTTEPLPNDLDASVFGSNTKRLGSLAHHSATWRTELADDDALHGACAEIFRETGDYWLSTAQLIEIGPGSGAQPLHADASGWWPFWSMGEAWQPEFAVNFLVAATDTTKENGATGVVKGSHRIKYSDVKVDATLGFWNFPDEEVEQVELKAGDCLLLGGRIVHRGEANRTKDEYRRILSCTVVSSALTPEEAHPLTMSRDMVEELPERVKKFFGFRGMKTVVGPHVWQDHRGDLKSTLKF